MRQKIQALIGPPLVCLTVFVLLRADSTPAQHPRHPKLDETKMSLFLVKPGAEIKPLKKGGAKIGLSTVAIEKNESIDRLLRKRGIHPDMDAVGLLYDLNPEVKDLKKLPPKLVLPFADGPDADQILKSGGLVAVVRDAKRKAAFVRVATDVVELAPAFSQLDKSRFASQEEQVKLTHLVTKSADTLGVFRMVVKGKTRPLGSDVLLQLDGEAAMFTQILKRSAESEKRLPAEDKDALVQLSESMSLRLKGLDEVMGAVGLPPRWPEIKVIVKTVDAKGVEKKNLQVYFVPVALYGKSDYTQPFDLPSSPTDRLLPEAYYFLWAEDPAIKPRKELGRRKVEVIRRQGQNALSVAIVIP